MGEVVFQKVVKAVGNQRKLAKALGVKPQSIFKWKVQIPADRVLQLEQLTGISRYEMRPDVFGEGPFSPPKPHTAPAAPSGNGDEQTDASRPTALAADG